MLIRSRPVAAVVLVASLSSLALLGHPPHAARPDAASIGLESQAAATAVNLWNRGLYLKELNRAAFLRAMAARGGGGGGCAPGDWECFKACTLNTESNGNYGSVSGSGTYRGGYQYSQEFWDGQATEAGRPDLVGTDPATASPEDQDYIAQHTYSTRGNDPWMGRC